MKFELEKGVTIHLGTEIAEQMNAVPYSYYEDEKYIMLLKESLKNLT